MKTLLTGILILFFFQLLAVGQLKLSDIVNPDDLRIDPGAAERGLSDAEIRKIRISVTARDKVLGAVLYEVAVRSGVPIGLEIADKFDDRRDFQFSPVLSIGQSYDGAPIYLAAVSDNYSTAKRRYSVDFKMKRLEEILDQLVGDMGDYVWWTEDGIVNIAPAKRGGSSLQELMSLKIKEFKFPAGRSILRLMDEVRKLPELTRFRAAFSHPGGHSRDLLTMREDLIIRDVSFKELLNKLAKINGCGWFASTVSVGNSEILSFSF